MVKVLIYEDNPQLREGLTMLIDGSEGFRVLGAFKNCSNIAFEVESYKPDVILMDIDMPGVNGIQGLKIVRQQNTQVSILMLTVFDDNKNIFEALQNGANGYILKKNSCQIVGIYTGSGHWRRTHDGICSSPGTQNVFTDQYPC
jgi:DNA-binding NarL/FixJ family response regulator